MNIGKKEFPSEKRIQDNIRNRQLAAIIRYTHKWMEVLFHESFGLLGNVNWVSKVMQEEFPNRESLPIETFAELNLTSQKDIYTFKEIYCYMQLMNVIADKRINQDDFVILNEDMLLAAIPRLSKWKIPVKGLNLKVSRAFTKVVIFLLKKLLDVAQQSGNDQQHLSIVFTRNKYMVDICVSSPALFWNHELWAQQFSSVADEIPSDTSHWPRQMFYEILALVDGKISSGCKQQRRFSMAGHHLESDPELIQSELDHRDLEFSIPFALESA